MKHKIAYRLALTYGLIFILAVAAIDAALVLVYRDNQLKKNENFYFGLSSMFATMVENNIKITNYINYNEGLVGQNNGRVLLLDTEGKVLLDSGSELIGVSLTNQEFRKALESGKPATGYYSFENKGMAMFSYPVHFSGHIKAVVMISVFIQDIYDDINRFAMQIIVISALVVIMVITASIWMGRRLSEPIVRLTTAAEQIYKGKIDTTVEINRTDEIGRLAGTFNRMSGELKKIETGRRRFISDVSHELKTPLSSIKALIEALIASETEDELCKEYLQDINHEIDRLTGLVCSLLTSARLEEVMIKGEPLLLAEEVDCAIRALLPLAAQKHISLENTCDRSVVIHADRNMLKEVLINLIDNSIKYGVQCGTVSIECSHNSFNVVDNGCGISEEDLPNIFDSFYRVDQSRTGENGSGIGLFIVKRIIELHGFAISVSSKPGSGSVFTVTF
ncbi:MAG: HAMP domain-containing histidine kinase [Clostridia bacterium]|nr:HAMP domain-containing histidine kinase [Clostridia bacterium]